MCAYVYVYVHAYACIHMYIYTHTHTNPTEVTAKENAERYNGIGGRGDCYTCEQEESL